MTLSSDFWRNPISPLFQETATNISAYATSTAAAAASVSSFWSMTVIAPCKKLQQQLFLVSVTLDFPGWQQGGSFPGRVRLFSEKKSGPENSPRTAEKSFHFSVQPLSFIFGVFGGSSCSEFRFAGAIAVAGTFYYRAKNSPIGVALSINFSHSSFFAADTCLFRFLSQALGHWPNKSV